MLESIELSGILSEETGFLLLGEFAALGDEIIRHPVGDGGDGARIVAAPHQFADTHLVDGFLDGPDG